MGRANADFSRAREEFIDRLSPQKPCAAGGGAGQALPKTAKRRLFQLILNWRRRAI
jgi:hypothetical protein